MIISLDTETSGLDVFHGCKPFFVTICDDDGPVFYEWDVDPETRQPEVPKSDLQEIEERINEADEIVGQNFKFDIHALASVGIKYRRAWYDKTHETTLSGHLLASSEGHDLTVMALRYLRIDITPYEEAIKEAASQARTLARREFPGWRIATDDATYLPSAGAQSLWKNDMWLPRAVAKELGYDESHPWWTVCSEYANTDSVVTLKLHEIHQQLLEERGHLGLYEERRKLVRIIAEMEERGVTYSEQRLSVLKARFQKEADEDEQECIRLSGGKLDKLPKSGTSNAMKELLFNEWKLPIVAQSKKTGAPSADKNALAAWLNSLDEGSTPHKFLTRLRTNRKKNTACSYMSSYQEFSVPIIGSTDTKTLHPSINPTGTTTLRMSSQRPNEQNISKQKEGDDPSVRYCFGPAPGREWWSFDFSNIELRIPAYKAPEPGMIQLFERPDDPPYFGSQHLLNSHVLWKAEFEQCLKDGVGFKDRYKDTLYQWTKNGDFAISYNAQEESGTADRAFHKKGGQAMLKSKFQNIERLSQETIKFARQHGYVETMVDSVVGLGYPLQTPATWNGYSKQVKPTIPLSYKIQGTAMWCTGLAMVEVAEYCDYLTELTGQPWYINLQVHDELVIDAPAKPKMGNAPKARKIRSLMESVGQRIGVPLTVNGELHTNNWSEGEKLK